MIHFINFISTPSSVRHKSIKTWYFASCSTLLLLLASLSVVSFQLYKRWHSVEDEYIQQLPLQKKVDGLMNEHAQLSKEKSALLEKTEELEKYSHYTKKPSDMLKAIQSNRNTSTSKGTIQSLCMIKRSVKFQMHVQTICAQTSKGCIAIAQNIQKSATLFNEVKLTAFKAVHDGAEAHFEATVAKA